MPLAAKGAGVGFDSLGTSRPPARPQRGRGAAGLGRDRAPSLWGERRAPPPI